MHDHWTMAFEVCHLINQEKPNILFNERFSNKELCPQSCINENVLEDKSVRKNRLGNSKNPFVIEGSVSAYYLGYYEPKAITGKW